MSANQRIRGDVPADVAALREHLQKVLDSRAFHGSRRSQQFLHHVVSKALNGGAAELKERNLGIELFGRSPEYDTGEDAIVRVTASDVRKRLRQYYSEAATAIQIELPAGSYAPEFRHVASPAMTGNVPRKGPPSRKWAILGACGLAAITLLGLWIRQGSASLTVRNATPWSYLFRPGRQPVLVLSDPDISAVQLMAGAQVSLSDYANGKYLPERVRFSPDLGRALQHFRGANVPTVDVGIALNIAVLGASGSASVKTRPARSLKLADLKTADDFILLGSPRSNPWTGLFQDHLDFYFAFDENARQEVIRNRRPRAGEAELYVPTARGWETGHAFAILALVGNPNQSGKALLLAGTNAEGTEAAGRLATDLKALALILEKCGVDPRGPAHHFEILLEVRTMAGSPNTFGVKACHVLEDPPVP